MLWWSHRSEKTGAICHERCGEGNTLGMVATWGDGRLSGWGPDDKSLQSISQVKEWMIPTHSCFILCARSTVFVISLCNSPSVLTTIYDGNNRKFDNSLISTSSKSINLAFEIFCGSGRECNYLADKLMGLLLSPPLSSGTSFVKFAPLTVSEYTPPYSTMHLYFPGLVIHMAI